jgi:chromosome segregation ATPase
MTQDDTTKRVTFLVPEQSWEEAQDKTDHGEMSERLRDTVNRVAHGADVAEEARLNDRLKTLREDRRELRQERDNIEQELEEVNRKIERVETRLEELREQDGEYDGVLAMLETDLSDGARVMQNTPKVKKAAKIGDCEPQDVIADLKERNPDVPDMAFRSPHPSEEANWKREERTL